jgi:hypothetical protein
MAKELGHPLSMPKLIWAGYRRLKLRAEGASCGSTMLRKPVEDRGLLIDGKITSREAAAARALAS